MQNGKNPNRREKIHLKSLGLNCENWLVSKKTLAYWLIINRKSGKNRKIRPLV